MRLKTGPYQEQASSWPSSGRHILAQFDDLEILVYQAYKPSIADSAVRRQRFGGEFSFERMSWIKPNFLWMMYRCGWATKKDQDRVLAVHLKREFFDSVLALAVETYFRPEVYGDRKTHREALDPSPVRLQWDPDHDPSGKPLERRAIQLGLKGDVLKEYASDAIVEIEDITEFVIEQRPSARAKKWNALLTPAERPYLPPDPAVRARIRLG
jgi:hypothetical protein